MPSNDRRRVKNRKNNGNFIALPKKCLLHENYISLTPHAVKLLIDLYSNYNGFNNGDLCCTWSMMKKRGWASPTTLNNARKELLYYGWIINTRSGGKNKASLYAVSFQSIDECKGKIHVKSTVTAPGDWKNTKQKKWKKLIQKEKICMPLFSTASVPY